ncbi:glycine betaine ABC transporter substrate-binding protein, partial [Kitasatospora sp. NPDC088346]|uniref:glycine betaine ABC transporter substrate-binding protein n=1 Tax=Kitasatospora sp. NPDC088346 TaxID=3364073 RepID=UPI0038123AEF
MELGQGRGQRQQGETDQEGRIRSSRLRSPPPPDPPGGLTDVILCHRSTESGSEPFATAADNIALSFHRAVAGVVRHLLESHGHHVTTVEAPHQEIFALQARGSVDVLVSAWLPGSHGAYLAPYRNQVVVLEPTYRPYCTWSVPPYVPPALVAEITDLARPEIAARMAVNIQGINPGAGISRFSVRMISEYGLDRLGYTFTPGTEKEFISHVEAAIAREDWFVTPLWRPQYLNRRHRLRALGDPKDLLGGVDAASTVIRLDAAERIVPAAMTALKRLSLGNDGVELLDEMIAVAGLSPLEAAQRHLLARRDRGGGHGQEGRAENRKPGPGPVRILVRIRQAFRFAKPCSTGERAAARIW